MRRFNKYNFRLATKASNPVRMQLTLETNFSLKIPDPIRPGSTLEEFRVITIRLQAVPSTERCSMKRKSIIFDIRDLRGSVTIRMHSGSSRKRRNEAASRSPRLHFVFLGDRRRESRTNIRGEIFNHAHLDLRPKHFWQSTGVLPSLLDLFYLLFQVPFSTIKDRDLLFELVYARC